MRVERDGITLTDEISVELIQQCGGDHMTVAAARASTAGAAAALLVTPGAGEANKGLINTLTKRRHGTPSEHGLLTFFLHAPAFVWWEWVRHRVGMTVDCPEMSFSLESGRYKKLEPVFWVPTPGRKMAPVDGFKPMSPEFASATETVHRNVVNAQARAYAAAWEEYAAIIGNGIANEVARSVLPFAVYYSGWVSCNPRSLMSFLSLRTHEPAATFPSFPQAEIEYAARAAEAIFAEHWPLQHAAFHRNGRVGP